MTKFKDFCQGKLNWFVLNGIRASFAARAITVYSLGVTVLSNSNLITELFLNDALLKTSVVGAIVFLVGYVAPFILASPEFRSPRGKSEIVVGWSMITDQIFYLSRRKMLNNLINRLDKKRPFDLDDGTIKWAQIRLAQSPRAGTDIRLKIASLQLYDAELELRSYDQFGIRLVVAATLAIGIVCMSITLVVNTWNVVIY